MEPFPHRYQVSAAAGHTGDVMMAAGGLETLRIASPAEFGGPGDRWSPETLLVGAVADCFILTFRALASYSRLPWVSLTCEVDGTLDRLGRATQFTGFRIRAVLRLPEGANHDQAERLLARAEETCLVTQSLKAPSHLEAEIEIVRPEPLAPALADVAG